MKDKNNLEPSDYKTGVSNTLNGLEVNVEMGLCTKDMAKENPIKDFEILIEEYKDKWSEQMYDYFKECLSIIKEELKECEEVRQDLEQVMKDYQDLGNSCYKQLKELETIKKCFYVAKSSGAILLTDYGFEHKEELKEVLL